MLKNLLQVEPMVSVVLISWRSSLSSELKIAKKNLFQVICLGHSISPKWNQWWVWSAPFQPAGTSCCWCFEYHHENNYHVHDSYHHGRNCPHDYHHCQLRPLVADQSTLSRGHHHYHDQWSLTILILKICSSLVRTTSSSSSSSSPFEVLQSSTRACGRSRVTGKLWWIDLRPANCSALLLQYVLEIHKIHKITNTKYIYWQIHTCMQISQISTIKLRKICRVCMTY